MERRLLILSDLHVGRDCKEITGFSDVRPDPKFDQAFIDLLDHYTKDEESSFRLVLGGDFVDFMEVVVVPGSTGAMRLSFEVTDEEKEFGLGSEPERAIVKLERTLRYHPRFFDRLAAYVKNGGELVLVRGNHDVEMFWPKVQREFRRRLAELAFANDKLDVDETIDRRSDFQGRIEILPWFYYEKDRIYFEHGHQYDPYCSFDHWLHPVSPSNPRRIDTPISLFAMRYFVNLLHDFQAHDVDLWSVKDYAQWLRQRGFGGSFYIGKMAFGVVFRAFVYGARWPLSAVRQYTKEHTRVLKTEAKRSEISARKLKTIDSQHAVPVSRNLPELMRLLFLDRVLLVLGSLLLAGIVLLVVQQTWLELVGMVLVVILALRINTIMEPRRYLLPGPKQAQVARRIADLIGVPLVVMGHSHVRYVADLGADRRYINTGCWLPPMASKDHTDVAEPCTCKLSHLYVPQDGAAELRVFCKAAKTVRLSDVEEMVVEPTDGGPTVVRRRAGSIVG